jgi:catechol 2,3-dioxygenase-like lactoylglutathione lyase family enzyme
MSVRAVDVGIVTRDDRLVDFYLAALPATRLDPRVLPMGTVHRLEVGPVTLKIMVPAEPPVAPEPSAAFWDRAGYRYVTLWVDDLDALVERWAANGGQVTLAPFALRPGVRTGVLTDPDGNAVEAMEER